MEQDRDRGRRSLRSILPLESDGENRTRRSPSRELWQSGLLVGVVGTGLVVKAAMALLGPAPAISAHWLWLALGLSLGLAAVTFLLRAATLPAAALGGLVCLNLLLVPDAGGEWRRTALPALATLFALTFAATRFGRARKERLGLAEAGRGRRAAQVAANLGVAGLCGGHLSPLLLAACLAALAEATADTLSSELGQVLGGRTRLITNGREVPPGTDGGVSLAGTALGVAGALVIVLMTAAAHPLAWPTGLVILGAAVAGLLTDSLLGATVERRGWLGNDLVNFLSTAVAAALALAGVALLGP